VQKSQRRYLAPPEIFNPLDQMSFTFTGFTVGRARAACFEARKNSLDARAEAAKNLIPKAHRQFAVYRSLDAGLELKNSFRLSRPGTKEVWVKGAFLTLAHLDGALMKNCFRLDQKIIGMRMSGASNLGTAEAGSGTARLTACSRHLGFVISGGRRLIILPGTVTSLIRRKFPRSVYPTDKIRAGRQRLRAPQAADTDCHSL